MHPSHGIKCSFLNRKRVISLDNHVFRIIAPDIYAHYIGILKHHHKGAQCLPAVWHQQPTLAVAYFPHFPYILRSFITSLKASELLTHCSHFYLLTSLLQKLPDFEKPNPSVFQYYRRVLSLLLDLMKF